MVLLYGRAGRLTAENGGFRTGQDHGTVVGVAKRLLAAAQAATEAAFLRDGGPPTQLGDGDGEPPAAGMIGIVAKLQAGIFAWHRQEKTPETARLLSRYTAMLLGFGARTIDQGLRGGGGVDLDALTAQLRWGPLEGLLPSWVRRRPRGVCERARRAAHGN